MEAKRGRKYYRIQGPTIIIEYDNTQNNGNHVHSVIRDLQHDFLGRSREQGLRGSNDAAVTRSRRRGRETDGGFRPRRLHLPAVGHGLSGRA